jgi:hypothetical protein
MMQMCESGERVRRAASLSFFALTLRKLVPPRQGHRHTPTKFLLLREQSTPHFTHLGDKNRPFVNYWLFLEKRMFTLAVTFTRPRSSNKSKPGQTKKMKKRNTIRIVMLVLVLTGAFIVFRSAASASRHNSSKESMDQCCKKKNAAGSSIEKTTWEHLSRQFFSSI